MEFTFQWVNRWQAKYQQVSYIILEAEKSKAGKKDREYLGEKAVRMSRDGCYEQAHSNKDTRSEPAVSGAVHAGHGELQRQGYAVLTPALPGLPALLLLEAQ